MFFSPFARVLTFFGLIVHGAAVALPPNPDDQAIERTTDGITFRSPAVILHVDVCSARVIHVVASPDEVVVPTPAVPVVTHPCGGAKFSISNSPSSIDVRTNALTIEIDRATSSVQFLAENGLPI